MEITYNGGPAPGHLPPQQALLVSQHHLPPAPDRASESSLTCIQAAANYWDRHELWTGIDTYAEVEGEVLFCSLLGR